MFNSPFRLIAKPRICLETHRLSGPSRTLIAARKSRTSGIFYSPMASGASSRARGRDRGRGAGDRAMTRESLIFQEKEKILNMTIEEKRKLYRCGSNYVSLDSVTTWAKMQSKIKKVRNAEEKFDLNSDFNRKISVWKGDITKLEIDAIANAANHSLLGGGGVDGAIHASAGSGLRAECVTLNGCDTGDAKITGGYHLPAKYVIHTVGPIGEKEPKLRDCYSNCLKLLKENKLRTLAFPCISTGIFGYPNRPAAHIALETVRKWMETSKNHELIDRIVFCMFQPTDLAIYEELMLLYFPSPIEQVVEEEEEVLVEVEEEKTEEPEETKDSKPEAENAEKNAEISEPAESIAESADAAVDEKPSPPKEPTESEKKT